ncbi:sugar ABC transporter substrate-binding protein [Capillimicrobium parvum]|uniref:Periplasmic binding protein domain-containing protein n=1 Tax=Capillimicrobium parvum TaxID=2884022 RepID=A0A9E6XX10_9ACTN|nr:sugar ABC transporter substrate-binding protein [Capillimicrobium parvum]UGS36039.1 hypothetical protein DSM104329_02436 [Capillimicrobium parvum]
MSKWVTLPASAMVVAALAGCGSSGSDGTSTTGRTTASTATGNGEKIAYASPVAAQPGQQEIAGGIEAAAQELGWTATVMDANLSADKQVANIDTAITQGTAAIASWTLDPGAAAGAYTRALSQGIPIIGMNSEGEGVTATVWWEYIRCEPGGPWDQTAELIADMRPGARVVQMSGPPAPSVIAETKCFAAAAKEHGLDVVETANNTADTAESALRMTQDLLTKHPKIDAIWAYNDQSALGVSAALVSAGQTVATVTKNDGVIVTGTNGDADAIDAIREERLTGTWDPNNFATGLAAVKQMQTALQRGAHGTYPPLTVKATFWTDENIDEYKPSDERGYALDDLPLVDGAG